MRRTGSASRIDPVRITRVCGLIAGLLGVVPTVTAAVKRADVEATSISEALENGTPWLQLRYRLESVSDDAASVADRDALASTLRTILGYQSAPFRSVSGAIELENVTVVGDDAYANGGAESFFNGVTDRPTIADPRITAVTRAYVHLASLPRTTLRVGRDELAYDNQRIIGPVGFRQHHQSFDALSVHAEAVADVKLAYDFAWQVNRIDGGSKPMKSHFVNASHRRGPNGVAVFYTHVDFDRTADAAASRATAGIRVDGRPKVGDWTLLYDLGYAEQGDVGGNPLVVEATYYHVEIGALGEAGAAAVTGRIGYERLGSNPTDGQFQTPLATLHAFNGWADKFLATPANGLSDAYVALAAKVAPFGFEAAIHAFSADEGDADYGTEINLEATCMTRWKQAFGVTAAFYDADTFAADTRKLWLWTQYTAR